MHAKTNICSCSYCSCITLLADLNRSTNSTNSCLYNYALRRVEGEMSESKRKWNDKFDWFPQSFSLFFSCLRFTVRAKSPKNSFFRLPEYPLKIKLLLPNNSGNVTRTDFYWMNRTADSKPRALMNYWVAASSLRHLIMSAIQRIYCLKSF